MSEQIEHGPDGTRWHEDSSYEGTVYPCLCGEQFVEHEALLEHIEKHATDPNRSREPESCGNPECNREVNMMYRQMDEEAQEAAREDDFGRYR